MSSWSLSNVDEMARFACAEEGSPLPEEKRRRRAMSVVDFTAAGRSLPSAGGAFCPNADVKIGADDDGIVPECPCIFASAMLDIADDGAFEGPATRWDNVLAEGHHIRRRGARCCR